MGVGFQFPRQMVESVGFKVKATKSCRVSSSASRFWGWEFCVQGSGFG